MGTGEGSTDGKVDQDRKQKDKEQAKGEGNAEKLPAAERWLDASVRTAAKMKKFAKKVRKRMAALDCMSRSSRRLRKGDDSFDEDFEENITEDPTKEAKRKGKAKKKPPPKPEIRFIEDNNDNDGYIFVNSINEGVVPFWRIRRKGDKLPPRNKLRSADFVFLFETGKLPSFPTRELQFDEYATIGALRNKDYTYFTLDMIRGTTARLCIALTEDDGATDKPPPVPQREYHPPTVVYVPERNTSSTYSQEELKVSEPEQIQETVPVHPVQN